MITRRDLICGALAVTLSGTRVLAAKPMPRPIGVRLALLESELKHDLRSTLVALREMGYDHVEVDATIAASDESLAGFKRANLTCSSMHAPPTAQAGARSLSADLSALITQAQTLGCQYLICDGALLPTAILKTQSDPKKFTAALRTLKLDDWKRYADFLNKTAVRVKAEGLTFAYHNQNIEFLEYKDESAYDVLLRLTDADNVKLQLDCAWMVAGRRDPLYYLKRHSGRIVSLHVSDLASGANDVLRYMPAPVGQGMIDWMRVVPAAVESGVTHFVVAQERAQTQTGSALELAQAAHRYLRTLPGLTAAR